MSRAINTITAATAVDGATNLNIDSGTLFVNTTTNFVGVGTTSPIRKLSLEGGGLCFQDAGGSTSRAISWIDSTTSITPLQILGNSVSGNCNLSFLTNAFGSAAEERLRIDSSGNVGIGTTSPSVASGLGLVINGGASQTRLAFKNTYTGDTSNDGVQFALVAASSSFIFQNRESDGSFAFETNSVERLRIDSSGNVGIGTANPIRKLSIEGGGLGFQEAGGANRSITWNDATSGNLPLSILGNSTAGNCFLAFATNTFGSSAAERMRIDSSGNVLIGGTAVEPAGGAVSGISLKSSTSATISNGMVEICNANSPALILGSTTGDAVLARFRRAGAHVGNISVSAGAAAFTSVSDYRLKTNLEPLSNGINRIKQLPVYRFNWISDESGNKLDGFLAHEAKSIVPECVIGEKDAIEEDGNPAYQGIDQSKIVPLLTAALKEAIAKIEVLESKVAALEAA